MKDFAGNEIDVPAVLKAIASIDWSRTSGLTNPERVDKWRARADEWARMAAQAENEHIGQHCLKEADFCEMMAALWCKP